MAVQKELDFSIHYGDPAVTGGLSVFSPEFDRAFAYTGNDLGVTYASSASAFRLWAPTASEVALALYTDAETDEARFIAMRRSTMGTWQAEVAEDLKGMFYTYRVKIGDTWNEACDPYAKAVGINGDRAAILNLAETDPEGWNDRMPPFRSPVDAVIYELHVRDLSSHPHSGVVNRGKFLGVGEAGIRSTNGILSGLDHVASLGVTHIQFLPIFDYSTESVDERFPEQSYNWGYDPKNYNAPEGSYASDPFDPAARIREMKQMVQALHDRGLRVIMDVVYNHVYDGYRIHFTKLVPGYYFRYREDGTLSDGAFCGNEVASERFMVRKYIVESILYWAREYRIDGFRFDLMGLLDVGTMQEIRSRLDEIDPSILVIGEGWHMDCGIPDEMRASQRNADRLPRIGQFNDHMRNAIKGSHYHHIEHGFVDGGIHLEQEVRAGAAGAVRYREDVRSYATEPDQCVNYVECHDNYTLWDKLEVTNGYEEEELDAMHRLASGMVMTSQGIAFLHAGQEFMRTKNHVENSYRSLDPINWLDWDRCAERQADVEYMRTLITLRRSHPAFRLRSAKEIRNHLHFEEAPDGTVAFTLREHAGGDSSRHLYVVYHGRKDKVELKLPALGTWEPLFVTDGRSTVLDNKLVLDGIAMAVLEVVD
ncbi:type I pullulanase [Gorillibacterium timonense]|uniref:type I pullulanase n=1 Tax=Gorillibacterium timonense TaxID=1689269 RepID=UPI00071DF7A8|nr:type I pullulanase [Gorillibacterium timonense]